MTPASVSPHRTPLFSPRYARASRAAAIVFAVGAAWLAGGPSATAQSQDMRALQSRLDRLERDISTLNMQLSRGGAPSGGSGAAVGSAGPNTGVFSALDARVGAMEDELRNTTGAIEELGHRIRQLSERLDKLVGDVDFRLSALERGGVPAGGTAGGPPPSGAPAASAPTGGSAQAPSGQRTPSAASESGFLTEKDLQAASRGGTPPPQAQRPAGQPAGGQQPALVPKTSPVQSAVLPGGSAREQYDYAFGLLRQANYDQAEAALREFLNKHPNDPLAPNARYWLGETFYVRGSYVESAQLFLEGYQAAPKGAKAPDALLKLGMSLANLDKKRDACATFEKLVREFPDAAPSLKLTLDRERQKSGCK
ncbi:MAG: tol-pal system protein YbgF [Rhodospirillales bacterium]|nr:tol-pal system protein YbgF [Rhodospirillales bacterium]